MTEKPSLPGEVVAVWLLFLVVAVEILVTYSRVPSNELYHVTGGGLALGFGRVLTFSNFPVALAAMALVAVISERVPTVAAVVSIVLCGAVLWPGVVDEANLDARPVNAIAACGVLLALGLTAYAMREGVTWSATQPADRVRLLTAVVALVVALPWIFAELGFFLGGARMHQGHPAVHHGHHHGMDGTLLLLTALLLSRVVPTLRRRGLRITLGAYLALMAAYGIGNIANDAWTEQIVKRGWTSWSIPNVLHPTISVAWALIVLGGAALYGVSAWWSRERVRRTSSVPPAAWRSA